MKPKKAVFGILVVVLAGLGYWLLNPHQQNISKTIEINTITPSVSMKTENFLKGAESVKDQSATHSSVEDKTADPLTSEQLALLDTPEVKAYLAMQENKTRLADYFNNDESRESAADMWDLIEQIESEGRVIAFEALAMKLAFVEKNSANELEYDAKAQELIAFYKDKATAAAKTYDPRSVPGFTAYKEAERQIIEKVNQMQSFPNNTSKQEYLRERLKVARIKAYGS